MVVVVVVVGEGDRNRQQDSALQCIEIGNKTLLYSVWAHTHTNNTHTHVGLAPRQENLCGVCSPLPSPKAPYNIKVYTHTHTHTHTCPPAARRRDGMA